VKKLALALLLALPLGAQYFPPLGSSGGGGGSGTVTSVTLAGTANEISATGTCSGTTVINCTISIPSAFILPGTIDGLTITTTTGTFTLTSGKTFAVGNTLTITGTDASTVNFPNPTGIIAADCVNWTKSGSTIGFGDAGAACGGGGGLNGINAQTISYTAVSGDNGKLVTMNGASLTATLPASPPSATWTIWVQNLNASALTLSRNGLLLNTGTNNITLQRYQTVMVQTDGTNYFSSVPVAGSVGNWIVCENGTGGYSHAWPSNFHGAMTISTTASLCSAQSFTYDGANFYALSSGVTLQ
jgi:hypothetical protein